MNKTTLNSQKEKHSIANFYPRSPCGERLHIGRGCVMIHRISIHALLAESDTTKVAGLLALIYISIHALLAESDGSSAVFSGCCTGISIHALLAESDADRIGYAVRLLYFYPRSPCGERPQEVSVRRGVALFLSTLSLRRATIEEVSKYVVKDYFYPRSPCGERRWSMSAAPPARPISIHALLAESDPQPGLYRATHGYFYPRSPCGERPRCIVRPVPGPQISIHALLAESDPQPGGTGLSADHFYPRSPCGERLYQILPLATSLLNFYPRSPCGERLQQAIAAEQSARISIHALLAESDYTMTTTICIVSKFLSTLSLRRATIISMALLLLRTLFLSTLSLRRATLRVLDGSKSSIISIHALLAESDSMTPSMGVILISFLSTLSLRRATVNGDAPSSCFGNFYPRSPCGERRKPRRLKSRRCVFLSTLSLRRATRQNYECFQWIRISIHALLAESDPVNYGLCPVCTVFLSTLSLRRATAWMLPS